MEKTFDYIINSAKLNNYKYYFNETSHGEKCLIVVRENTEKVFAYMIVNNNLTKVAEAVYTLKARNTKLYLNMIKVQEDLRGHGIGRCVMESLIHFASEIKCKEIYLIAAKKVRNFYSKLGYVQTDEDNGFAVMCLKTSSDNGSTAILDI